MTVERKEVEGRMPPKTHIKPGLESAMNPRLHSVVSGIDGIS
jgi:hypothetical protein